MADHRGNVKGTRLPVEVLTEQEVAALVGCCSGRAPTGLRNRALLYVLYRAQLRVSEALSLRPCDVDMGKGQINVRRGKGARQRMVAVDPGTLAHIGAWLAVRGHNGHHPLFCTLKGEGLKSAYVRTLLPRLARKAGIEKRVHPHGLRHSGASALLDRGASLADIQAQLGHSAPSTTDRYLHALNPAGRAERLAALWKEQSDAEA